MTSPQMTRLDEHLQQLRLNTVRERLEALLQEASDKELSYADFLDGLLREKVSAKAAKHVTMRTNLARFPVGLGLKAIEHGQRVLFTTAAAMLTTLTKALNEGRFDDKLKVFTIPRLNSAG